MSKKKTDGGILFINSGFLVGWVAITLTALVFGDTIQEYHDIIKLVIYVVVYAVARFISKFACFKYEEY